MQYVECELVDGKYFRIKREISEKEYNESKNNRPQMVYPIDPIDWQFITRSIYVR